ncbi:MAG: hypothetical protein Q9225_004556 [Loekoesia sp. 1 TL-2023]
MSSTTMMQEADGSSSEDNDYRAKALSPFLTALGYNRLMRDPPDDYELRYYSQMHMYLMNQLVDLLYTRMSRIPGSTIMLDGSQVRANEVLHANMRKLVRTLCKSLTDVTKLPSNTPS